MDPCHHAKEIRVHCKFDMHLLTDYLDWNFVRKNLILIRFDWMLINPNIYKDTHLAQSVLTSSLGSPMGLSGRIGRVGGWAHLDLVMHPYAWRKPEENSKTSCRFCLFGKLRA